MSNIKVCLGNAKINDLQTGTVDLDIPLSLFRCVAQAQLNKTGNGAVYEVLFAIKTFDLNTDFATAGLQSRFTAPVTGYYFFNLSMDMSEVATAEIILVQLIHGSTTETLYNWAGASGPATTQHCNASVIAYMVAAEEAYIECTITDIVGDTADILNGAAVFSGYRLV